MVATRVNFAVAALSLLANCQRAAGETVPIVVNGYTLSLVVPTGYSISESAITINPSSTASGTQTDITHPVLYMY